MVQLLGLALLLSLGLYLAVRVVADRAAEATQDNILGASATSIAEALRAADDGILVDIPYSALAMLGELSDDRVFYRIVVGDETVTGYETLPLPPAPPRPGAPIYYTTRHLGAEVRVAATLRGVPVEGRPSRVLVLVAQTREGQAAIARQVAGTAAGLGIGFFAIAGALAWIATVSTLSPIARLVAAIGRRGPSDLRPIAHPAPTELQPLLVALNGFMARLSAAHARTETFIAEAAHHLRTPLATVRARAETALWQEAPDDTRRTLRAVIRATDEANRTASQLLDHAMVAHRSESRAHEPVDLAALVADICRAATPAADMRDIELVLDIGPKSLTVEADSVLLGLALRNLVDNAIKYAEPETRVHIRARRDDDRAVIEICDRGRGLAGAAPADLKARFSRGPNAGQTVGSGLGLAIVDEVARAHGGTLELSERDGGGTCARFSLPS